MLAFSTKTPAVSRNYGADFTKKLVGNSVFSVVVTLSVIEGVDPNPAAMLVGSPFIIQNVAAQRLTGGLPGVTYLVTYTVISSSGDTLVGQVALPVANLLP